MLCPVQAQDKTDKVGSHHKQNVGHGAYGADMAI